MDVQDEPGTEGPHTPPEPPADDAPAAAADDPRGHDPTVRAGRRYSSASGAESTPSGDRDGRSAITVEVDGRTRELPAEHDYTGDGRPDAAVETPDGRVIVFSDTEDNETGAAEPDGRADEAWIVDKATGRVIGAARVDPDTGEWVDGLDPSGPGSGSS